ncbi:MAG: hypothetical protein AAF433_17095 [Bacteroidota bacterium]
MKRTSLLVLLFLYGVGLAAQNFYVALVKGEVYYQEQLLKPRDKVTLEGEFRFTSSEDFVKIAGPTGIHTIRPVEKPGGGWEFILAVTEELFPAPRLLSTSVLSTMYCPGDFLNLYCPNEYSAEVFFDGEARSQSWNYLKVRPAEVHYLFQTEETGIQLRPASTTEESFVVRLSDFALDSLSDSILNNQMLLIAIHDQEVLAELIDQINANDGNLSDLTPALAINRDRFEYLVLGNYSGTAEQRSEEQKSLANRLLADMQAYSRAQGWEELNPESLQDLGFWRPATHLTELAPAAVIERDELLDDAYFYFQSSPFDDFFDFMIGLAYDAEPYSSVLREQYGYMNFRAIVDYFEEYYLPQKRWEETARRMVPSIIRSAN